MIDLGTVGLGDLALLRPWWLLAVPAAATLAFVAARRSGGLGDWRKAVDPHLFEALTRRGAMVTGKGRSGLIAAIAAAVIALALVGPAIERPGAQTFRNLDAVVIAFDLSRSVADSPQFRDAKIAAYAAAEAAGSRQVSIVVYAGDAYLANPPTSDRRALETTIYSLGPDVVPDPGSAPTTALALAHRTLKAAGVLGGDVVLVSDGGGINQGAEAEARSLAADGHALSTLYVEPAAKAPKPEGAPGQPQLDGLAAIGGGTAATVAAPDALFARLANDTASRLGAGAFASLVWLDLGRALLLLACAPMLLMFRRSA